jgi:hypothetical protein
MAVRLYRPTRLTLLCGLRTDPRAGDAGCHEHGTMGRISAAVRHAEGTAVIKTSARTHVKGIGEVPDTFQVTIAVTTDGMPLVIDWPDWVGNLGYFDTSYEPESAGFVAVPTEPGLYRCTVSVPGAWPLVTPHLPITTVYRLCSVDGSRMNATLLRLGGKPVTVKAD